MTVPPALQDTGSLQTAEPLMLQENAVFGWQDHVSTDDCGGTTVGLLAVILQSGTTVTFVVAVAPLPSLHVTV